MMIFFVNGSLMLFRFRCTKTSSLWCFVFLSAILSLRVKKMFFVSVFVLLWVLVLLMVLICILVKF